MLKNKVTGQAGWTLLEIALSLLILSVLVTISLPPLSRLAEGVRQQQEQLRLLDIQAALMQYALEGGQLPCPANDESGVPRVQCTTSDARRGFLPWQVLGVPGRTVWGQRYHYAVAASFSQRITLASRGEFVVNDSAGRILAQGVAAVVLAPRVFDTSSVGSVFAVALAGGGSVADTVPLGVWLSPLLVKNRLNIAGVLH